MAKISEIGKRYGRLIVAAEVPRNTRDNSRHVRWRCLCDCGGTKVVPGSSLRNGGVSSCGCLFRESHRKVITQRNITHGQKSHPLYNIWQGMLHRCQNPNNAGFLNYGGRGIKVCEDWQNLPNFISWVENNLGPRPPQYSLDRINNNGDYRPGNVRWADAKTQAANKRIVSKADLEFVYKTRVPLVFIFRSENALGKITFTGREGTS